MIPGFIEHSHIYFADVAQREEERRRLRARAALDPADVLSETMHLMLEVDDAQHPLRELVEDCTRRGTPAETGSAPYRAQHVGGDLLPLIERAINRLIQEALLREGNNERF